MAFCWVKYIDDLFFIWTEGHENLKAFLDDQDLNKFRPNVKYESDSSKENVAFVNLKVKLKQGKIEVDLDVKPTDRHQYLHYTSSNSEPTKRSLVFIPSLRVRGYLLK